MTPERRHEIDDRSTRAYYAQQGGQGDPGDRWAGMYHQDVNDLLAENEEQAALIRTLLGFERQMREADALSERLRREYEEIRDLNDSLRRTITRREVEIAEWREAYNNLKNTDPKTLLNKGRKR